MKRIGLIGFGFIGKIHLETFQKLDQAEVISIFTKSSETINLPYYQGKVVSTYEEMLNDPLVDVVDICLPTYLHEEYIILAARAGKHIICEKPLTLTTDSAKRIVEAVEQNKVQLLVGHVLRFWPEYQKIKELVVENQQEFSSFHAERLGQIPKWSTWFQVPDLSGGALFDLHIHDIDFLLHAIGKVESVYAVGHQNKWGAWDEVQSTLLFKNQAVATVHASQRMPGGFPFTMKFRAIGHERAIVFDFAAGDNIDDSTREQEVTYYAHGKRATQDVETKEAFSNEMQYFLECIEGYQINQIIPVSDVLYTLKVLSAIKKSLEIKQIVCLN